MNKKMYKRNKRVAGRVLDGKFCLMNPKTCELIVMNETGTFLWDLLKEEINFETIMSKMICEFDAPEEEIKKDLVEFLNKLTENELLV